MILPLTEGFSRTDQASRLEHFKLCATRATLIGLGAPALDKNLDLAGFCPEGLLLRNPHPTINGFHLRG